MADGRAREIVGPERGLVRDRAPVMRKLLAPVAEFEQRFDDLFLSLRGGLDHGAFNAGLLLIASSSARIWA